MFYKMAGRGMKLYIIFMIPRVLTKETDLYQRDIYKDSKSTEGSDYKNTEIDIDEDSNHNESPNDPDVVTKNPSQNTNSNFFDSGDRELSSSHVSERTMVMDENLFPFMASVMRGTTYICAGALIDESWVLTAADGLLTMSGSMKFLRVRLGSINYRKGGELLPVKYMEIHPYFHSRKPTYDLALVMLAKPVRYTPSLRPVRLQLKPAEVTGTHFMVTSWPGAKRTNQTLQLKGTLNHRILSLSHLHPTDPEECDEELREIEASSDGVMCLETGYNDTCMRDVGAPVIFNGALLGIISSWKPDDCEEEDPAPVFATLVSAENISSWMHATVHGHKWDS